MGNTHEYRKKRRHFTFRKDWNSMCIWIYFDFASFKCDVLLLQCPGWGNSIMVSISVYQAGSPGLRLAQSACHRKVEFYHCVIDSFPQVPTTGSNKAIHVLFCLCNNACKRSLAICRESRTLCPVSRLLSVPIYPVCA